MLSIMEKMGFGGGCHWCTEAIFASIVGVAEVEQGWIRPAMDDRFSEAVLVEFDQKAVSIAKLVAIHLYSHSATSTHSLREKYRSAVYVFNNAQTREVERSILQLQKGFTDRIITQVLEFGEFKLNSAAFLNYYASDPDRPFCRSYITPKLNALLERFGKQVRPII